MKKNHYIAATLLRVFFLSFCCTIVFAQGFSPQTQSRFQKVLDSFQTNPENPYIGGMSAAIKVDGLAFWEGATGYAARNIDASNNLLPGGTPFTTATPSRIYSITKPFTAALVLQLVQEGTFALSDPVHKFLPLHLINPKLNATVTIGQLLAHESGYSDFLLSQDLQIAVAFQPTRVWTPFEAISFATQETAPGTVRDYASTNYTVLGTIIEAATGKPVAQLFRERFFDPLHLTSMYLAGREPAGNRGQLAAPHDNISALNPVFQLTGQPTFPDTFTNISRFPFTAIESIGFTSGGIVSNVADVAAWGNHLFSGRATGKVVLDQMLRSIASTPDIDGDFLGYGIFRSTKISETDVFIGHNGNATGYRSVMFYQPERKMTIAILTNFRGADLYAVAKALFESVPDFLCGNDNRKEPKILVCWKGKPHCIARPAADGFIKKGAYLGSCVASVKSKQKNNQQAQKTAQPKMERASATEQIMGVAAYPNPFRAQVTLSFRAEKTGNAVLWLYDANGHSIRTLYSGRVQEGVVQKVVLQAGNLPSGMYFTQLQTAHGIRNQKLLLQR